MRNHYLYGLVAISGYGSRDGDVLITCATLAEARDLLARIETADKLTSLTRQADIYRMERVEDGDLE